MTKQFTFLFCVFALAFLLVSLAVPALAADPGAKKALEGLNTTASMGFDGSEGGKPQGVAKSIPQIIGRVVGAGLAFIGIIFFLLMIYGGFIWMMARGNDQEVDKAKTLIQSAVIGLIIVLSAYAVTAFIGGVLLK